MLGRVTNRRKGNYFKADWTKMNQLEERWIMGEWTDEEQKEAMEFCIQRKKDKGAQWTLAVVLVTEAIAAVAETNDLEETIKNVDEFLADVKKLTMLGKKAVELKRAKESN